MRHSFAAAAAALLGIGTAQAQAQPALLQVATLQPPAWIDRDGLREALRPGSAIQPGDRLETGEGGRLQLEFDDASVLQLGERSRLVLEESTASGDLATPAPLPGLLSLTQGQLRFSGDPVRPREIRLAAGSLQIRLRDSDLWAAANAPGDLACLLQGAAEVTASDAPALALDATQPCVASSDDGAIEPAPTGDDAIATALARTEADPAQASLRQDGRYRVVLASVGTQAQADREIARLAALGYPLEALPQPAPAAQQTRYRLAIGGLPDHAQAKRLVQALKQRLGITGWVLVPD
jgi:hypothetical protein